MGRFKDRDDRSQGHKFGPADFRTITASDTVRTGEDGEDGVILANATGGAITVTLPNVADDVMDWYIVKKTDSSGNAVTVDGSGAETVVLVSQYDSATLITDGSVWHVVGKVGTWT
jgi:hypothetical protein